MNITLSLSSFTRILSHLTFSFLYSLLIIFFPRVIMQVNDYDIGKIKTKSCTAQLRTENWVSLWWLINRDSLKCDWVSWPFFSGSRCNYRKWRNSSKEISIIFNQKWSPVCEANLAFHTLLRDTNTFVEKASIHYVIHIIFLHDPLLGNIIRYLLDALNLKTFA